MSKKYLKNVMNDCLSQFLLYENYNHSIFSYNLISIMKKRREKKHCDRNSESESEKDSEYQKIVVHKGR